MGAGLENAKREREREERREKRERHIGYNSHKRFHILFILQARTVILTSFVTIVSHRSSQLLQFYVYSILFLILLTSPTAASRPKTSWFCPSNGSLFRFCPVLFRRVCPQ